MTTRVVTALIAAATALLSLTPALAQVEHAQRLALDVAIRRAQVRAQLCDQARTQQPQQTSAAGQSTRLPSSPPVGTAGPVDCSRAPWTLGR